MASTHIVYGIDDKYLPCLLVSMYSVLKTITEPVTLTVFVAGQEFDHTEIYKLAECFPNTEVNIRKFEIENLSDVEFETKTNRFPPVTMVPLFVPTLVEERSLFLDADTIVLQDISKLFHSNMGGALVGVVQHYWILVTFNFASSSGIARLLLRPQQRKYLKAWKSRADRINFTIDEFATKYFSTGVILFDGPAIRTADPKNKLVDLRVSKNSWDFFPDEEHFNIFFKDRVHYLDLKWNVNKDFSRLKRNYFPSEQKSELINAIDDPGILHFANIFRKCPWKRPWYRTRKRFRIYKQLCKELQTYSGIDVISMFDARL